MLKIHATGSFGKTSRFLVTLESNRIYNVLERYGREGVDLLSRFTPKETGLTAHAWEYRIEHTRNRHTISWYNSHIVDGVNIAVIIQYGHGTGTGGYVQGIDYINPALRPLFDKIAEDIWRQVKDA